MKKLLTSLLCVMMVVCFMPAMAWADGDDPSSGSMKVAEINGIQYESLQKAVDAIAEGGNGTILLLEDQTLSETLLISAEKQITLDLGGKTLSGRTDITGKASLIVKNGTISGKMPLNVFGSDEAEEKSSSLTVEKTVTVSTTGWGIVLWPNDKNKYTSGITVDVYGTVNAGTEYCGIFVSGNIQTGDGNVVNVYDGAIIKGGSPIAINGDAHVNVYGGQITGSEFAIGVKNGCLNVENGELICNGEYTSPVEPNNSGTEATGAAISISSTYDHLNPEKIKVTVSGGKISSVQGNGISVYESKSSSGQLKEYIDGAEVLVTGGDFQAASNKDSVSIDNSQVENTLITGGTFSSDVASYLPSGMQAIDDDGKYVIETKADVEAQIGTAVYATLSDAIAKAKSGDVIELLKDVECNGQVLLPEGVTLDGKGYSISASETANIANGGFIQAESNADNVTIKNLTVNTNGKAKHGIQYYCVTGGKVNNVIVNGGYYTSIIVNGSEVEIRDCTLNPETSETPGKNAYANIEYAMGSNVNTIPKITVTNVTGSAEKPLVYADEATINGVKTEESLSDDAAAVVKKINEEYLDGAKLTYIKDNEVVSPGTVTYTITFNANGGTVATESAVTNEAGKLAELPTPTYSGYTFKGWFTASTGGERVTANTEFIEPTTIYAHWTSNSSYVSTTPTTQKPVIEPNADVTTSLSTDGTTLTIKANDGYEITDVTVNGVSKGAVTTLTGLKTGDKIVIKTQKIETPDDNAALIEAVKNTKLIARSAMSTAKGKKAVKVSWYAADGSDLDFDGYEVFRSLKRYRGFGTTPIFKTANEKYYNTAIKKGNKYYYKVRAYKVIDGEKVYTDWSTKAWRTVK